MDELGQKALEYLAAFEELAKQYAPDVVDAGLAVVQIDALGTVITGLFCSLFVAGFVCFCMRSKWLAEQWNNVDAGGVLVGFVGGVASGFCTIAAFTCLANIWTWVALFNPKLYIAYKLFEKVL